MKKIIQRDYLPSHHFRRSAQSMGFSDSWLLQVIKNKCKYVRKVLIWLVCIINKDVINKLYIRTKIYMWLHLVYKCSHTLAKCRPGRVAVMTYFHIQWLIINDHPTDRCRCCIDKIIHINIRRNVPSSASYHLAHLNQILFWKSSIIYRCKICALS